MIIESDVGVCMSSTYEEGHLVVMPDAIGGALGFDSGIAQSSVSLGTPGGLVHRPMDPAMAGDDVDPTKCCDVHYWWEGAYCYSVPLSDPRFVKQLPELDKGATVLYGGSEAQVSLVHITADAKVKIGTDGATVPAVRAPELLQWMEATEAILATIGAATIPPTKAAVDAWKTAMAPIKEALKATLVEVT